MAFDSLRRDIQIGGQTLQYYAINELDKSRYGKTVFEIKF